MGLRRAVHISAQHARDVVLAELESGHVVPEGIVIEVKRESRQYVTAAGAFFVPAGMTIAVIAKVDDEILELTREAVRTADEERVQRHVDEYRGRVKM